VTGLAIGIMHYVGMAAVRAPAVTIWDPDYVAASLVVGVVLMSCGMQVALRSDDRKSLPGGVALFTLAICGLHFTGMTAFSLRPDPTVAIPYVAIAPVTLAVGIAAVAFFALSTALAIVLFDRQKTHLRQLQATTGKLEHLSAELRKALDDAHTANRAKTIFFASMSHELRTPLNAILGFSEMLLMEAVAPLGHPRNAEYVRDIHASGLRLMSLINDILDISRAEAGKMQLHDTTIDLDKLAAGALRLVEIQAAKGKVSLFCDIARDVPRIFGDRKRLEQVLLNLLSNAIKFTPEGGRVTVRIVRDGEGVRIDVSDTGIGIAESDIETVLSPFAQVDSYLSRKHDGTGLGLPIAKKLVELHGGTLCMRSQPGAGTTVTITLPLSRPDCAATGAQDDPGRSMLQVADG
jgi:signal transduction histidine kinase